MFCRNCGKEVPQEGNFCPYCGFNSNQKTTGPSSGYQISSTGTRFANYILDYIFAIIFAVILAVFWRLALHDTLSEGYSSIINFFYLIIYYLFFEGIWRRTPGKFITKTKVVMEDGSKPDFLHILGRTFARIIPFEPFSFLGGPRGWHDSLSKTLVVPKDYTAEQVQQIDLKNQPKTRSIIVIVVVLFFTIAIIGLLSSVALLALNSARAKSRDAKRLADVRQIASALELYYNDYGQYPKNLNSLREPYLGTLPTAPTPADGKCDTYNNQYQYTLYGLDNFQLSFCLGTATGGYPEGVNIQTPEGIKK